LFSASTATTRRFLTVTPLLPICPGIFCPGKIRAGSAEAPTEPGCRMLCEPCETGPRPKPWRLTVPWNPLPLETAVTCTLSPRQRHRPRWSPPTSPETSRSSLRWRRGGTSCFSNWPACGLLTLRVGTVPKPTWTAL
jgi:hypothetical protein